MIYFVHLIVELKIIRKRIRQNWKHKKYDI